MNPGLVPQRKVMAGGFAGALSTLVVWGAHEFGGITIPAQEALAVYTLLAFVVQYLVPNAPAFNRSLP